MQETRHLASEVLSARIRCPAARLSIVSRLEWQFPPEQPVNLLRWPRKVRPPRARSIFLPGRAPRSSARPWPQTYSHCWSFAVRSKEKQAACAKYDVVFARTDERSGDNF